MSWTIKCNNPNCGEKTRVANIVDLIKKHTNDNGWFVCGRCKQLGHIEKSFNLQEPGSTWKPYLRGVIPLGEDGATYQPFVFLVSYEPTGNPNDIWFSYYKDLRNSGGRLKLGYGPGGPPVLGSKQVISILKKMINIGCLSKDDVIRAISNDNNIA